MIRRLHFLSLFLLVCAGHQVLHAQVEPSRKGSESSPVDRKSSPRTKAPAASPQTPSSAKEAALQASGTIRDIGTDDILVAQALYVKLTPAAAAGNRVATVIEVARAAGLSPRMATPLTMSEALLESSSTTPLSNSSGKAVAKGPIEKKAAPRSIGTLERLMELQYDAPLHPREAARRLAGIAGVEYAEPIQLPRLLASPDDPLIERQYQLGSIRALQAWDIWQGDSTIVIGIVDAGVDYGHEDLFPNVQANAGEAGNDSLGRDRRTNRVDDDGNGVVDDWMGANLTWQEDSTTPGQTRGSAHGTQVSGLAAATTNNGLGIAGVAYKCRFFPIKAARIDGGFLTRAYEGIIYCARRGFKVINCSWGSTGYSQALQDIIRSLVDEYDCAIIAASGNSPVYSSYYPAGYDGVLGVGAIDLTGAFTTTWGEQVDVAAPGGFTTSDGNEYLDVGIATSYAAPLVSGTVALVRSRFPDLTARQALAHVRLTCDTMTSQLATQFRLTGYGRINVERAVGTPPLSHPAIVVDSVTLVDQSGEPSSRLTIGGEGFIRLRVRNLLGEARSLRIRIVHYTEDRDFVQIDSSWVDLGTMPAGVTTTLAPGIPFQIIQIANKAVRFRIEITADNYVDYQYGTKLFYQPYITERTSAAAISLTDHGRIGFDDIDGVVGDGVTFDGRSMLYEGGFFMASDAAHVLSNTRNAIPDTQQDDFRAVEYPAPSNGFTLTLLDDEAISNRTIGLTLKARLVSDQLIPSAVAVELRTLYTGNPPLDTLRLAMFADWDLDNDSYGQGVAVRERPGAVVPLMAQVTGRGQTVLAHGVIGPVPLPIAYPFRNDSLPFNVYNDGFANEEKWISLSNGIGVSNIPSSVSIDSNDISLVIGRRHPAMTTGAVDTTIFVIGFGRDTLEARQAMDNLAARLKEPASAPGGSTVTPRPLSTPWPNPAKSRIGLVIAPVRRARLTLVNAQGEVARDLSDRVTSLNGPSLLTIALDDLPAGVYFIHLQSAEGLWVEKVVKE